MTAAATIGGLIPIMWSHGAGASITKRIAAPMIGGLISTVVITLLVLPVVYSLLARVMLRREGGGQGTAPVAEAVDAQVVSAPQPGDGAG
jgi:Cu(I)/Ag(I) efflux system membrane protein CusA/SilA